ncbi:Armadillo-type fold [Nitzschia inconspicua]|uniref:Armadillo-type fold n=1 Tax=Nitzschia inconspicua TaxID=303405 RepID=A0A9K3PUN2_9STRA|nr:Armadillo-type fold [Nitzschia inconspicua]
MRRGLSNHHNNSSSSGSSNNNNINSVEQSMLNAGNDIVPDRRDLAKKRQKQGKCPTCAVPTHKVNMLGKRTPLTVEGSVLQGRCLKCQPVLLEASTTRSSSGVPTATVTPSPNSSANYYEGTPMTGGASDSPRGRLSHHHQQQQQQQQQLQQQQHPPTLPHHQSYPGQQLPSQQPQQLPSSSSFRQAGTQYYYSTTPPAAGNPTSHLSYAQPALGRHQQQQQQPDYRNSFNPHNVQQQQQQQQLQPRPMSFSPDAYVSYPHQQLLQHPPQSYPAYNNNMLLQSETTTTTTTSGIAIPRTLEVGMMSDDASIVSQITMDVRLFDDGADLVPPPSMMRRPGPEQDSTQRPGRRNDDRHRPVGITTSTNGSGTNIHRRRVNHPVVVIREEEEYEPTQTSTPLGLDPSATRVLGGAGSWDKEADIDALLRGNIGGGGGGGGGGGANSSRSSRTNTNHNNSSGEIVLQPHDIVMDTPLAAAIAPAPAIATRSPPQLFQIMSPPDDGPSLMEESGIMVDVPWHSSPAEFPAVDSVVLRQMPTSGPKYYRESGTINSSPPPPLREFNVRGRADSARIIDPNVDLQNDDEHDHNDKRDETRTESQPAGDQTKQSPTKRAQPKKREPRGMAARAAERAIDATPPTHSDLKDVTSSPQRAEQENGKVSKSPKSPKKKKQVKTKKSEKKKLRQQKEDMHDIPVIMHCLNLDECDSHMREKALDSLATILWRSSKKGREFILDHKGVDTLNAAMWADMESPQVQSAALHLLLAMAASSDGLSENDMLCKDESICDSVLFTMQNHARVPEIQLRGCLIFACLAGASSNNKKISDGSLSNALLMILNAMDNHLNDFAIQKAGLQGLYHQCLASAHAEANKRTLMDSRLDSGIRGLDVVLRAMEYLQDDHIAIEWAFRLCWCLTSSEDLVKSAAEISLPESIVPTCTLHIANPAAAGLVEASLGAIGNLAHLERTHRTLVDVGAVGMIIQALDLYPNDFGVCYEAVAAMANLSFSSFARESFVMLGAVQLTVKSLDRFLDIHEYAEEGLRALVCLLIGSSDAKSILISTDIVKTIADASERHVTLPIQHLCCSLVASLSLDPTACDLLVGRGAIGLVLNAMESFAELEVQEAGCFAFRNMFCRALSTDIFLEGGDTEKVLVAAMSKHKNAVNIQTNACSALWHMISKSEDSTKVVTSEGVKCIVKAMQSHMECGELVEQACGALWNIVHDSVDRKEDFVGNGAIDAVTCAIAMHPEAPETLEKACGVLSNVSSEVPLAEAIANAQGVTIVAEALRNNPSHLPLLEVGCLTLRNIAFLLPDVSSEASVVIATVVNALDDNRDAIAFQKEACNLLWILASADDSCQSKILALDGLTVLMKCLEGNKDDSELQRSALGAFNKLSFSSQEEED